MPTYETTEATPTTFANTVEDANTFEINNATTPNNNDKATIGNWHFYFISLWILIFEYIVW